MGTAKQRLLYMNGTWQGHELDGIEVVNPSTGEMICTVSNGGEAEANEAIRAADVAFQSWSQTTAYERASYLKRLYDLMIEHQEALARIMTQEMGKPINEAFGEVVYAANYLEWYAEEGKRVYGTTLPTHTPDKRLQTWRKPVGVVAAITPWNFPLAMLTRKMGPALAAGCTIVIKPSSESPLSAIKLMELCEQAGFPRGVINLVTGSSRQIGKAIMESDVVQKVTFTGSTEVGKVLIEQSAKQVKRLSLELGGHAPMIVLNDANVDVAVEGAIASAFRNTGQTCVCANRIYVQSGIHDKFVEKFSLAVSQLKVGDGRDSAVQIGPLINKASIAKVTRHVDDACAKGAKVLAGGHKISDDQGLFYAPTVLSHVDPSMTIMQEETFGPVAPIQKNRND